MGENGGVRMREHLLRSLNRGTEPPELLHTRILPEREAVHAPWPQWVHPEVIDAFQGLGVQEPYRHQVLAADLAHAAQAKAAPVAPLEADPAAPEPATPEPVVAAPVAPADTAAPDTVESAGRRTLKAVRRSDSKDA